MLDLLEGRYAEYDAAILALHLHEYLTSSSFKTRLKRAMWASV